MAEPHNLSSGKRRRSVSLNVVTGREHPAWNARREQTADGTTSLILTAHRTAVSMSWRVFR